MEGACCAARARSQEDEAATLQAKELTQAELAELQALCNEQQDKLEYLVPMLARAEEELDKRGAEGAELAKLRGKYDALTTDYEAQVWKGLILSSTQPEPNHGVHVGR